MLRWKVSLCLENLFFVLAHYQSLILGRNSCKHFHLIVKEVIWILLNEIVVYSIVVVNELLIFKITDFFCVLVELTIFITIEVNYLQRIIHFVVAFSLNYSDWGSFRNHSDHYGSLDTEENVITSDYLGVNIAVS